MRWFFIGIVAFASACLYAVRGPEDHAPYAYAVAFLALLGALPFAPAQTAEHYGSHLLYGLLQLPLLWASLGQLRRVDRS